MTTRATGIAIAFVTAVISGISVYVNSKGVSHFDDATVYTTAKNAVAGLLLVALALPVLMTRPAQGGTRARPAGRREWLGLVARCAQLAHAPSSVRSELLENLRHAPRFGFVAESVGNQEPGVIKGREFLRRRGKGQLPRPVADGPSANAGLG